VQNNPAKICQATPVNVGAGIGSGTVVTRREPVHFAKMIKGGNMTNNALSKKLDAVMVEVGRSRRCGPTVMGIRDGEATPLQKTTTERLGEEGYSHDQESLG
jgi:hypothetical protein